LNKIAERSGLLSILLIPISLPLAVITLFSSFVLFLKEKRRSFFMLNSKMLSIIILSVIFSVFLSAVFSINKSKSALSFFVFILYFLVLFLVKELNKEKVIKALILGSLSASLFAVSQIIFNFIPNIKLDFLGKIPLSIGGMAIGFQKNNSLPRLFVMVFPLSIVFLKHEKNTYWRYLSVCFLIIATIALIPTKPFGAILAFLILFLIFLFLKDWRFGLGFMLLILTPVFIKPDILGEFMESVTGYSSIAARINTWINFVLPVVLEKNFFTGFGIGCYTQAAKTFTTNISVMKNHPHSLYFYILAETGILGFISIFSLIFTTLFISFKNREKNYLYIGIFFAILGFLLEGLITSYLEYIPIGMVAFSVLGLAIQKNKNSEGINRGEAKVS
jgi:O-antigen ligase